MNRMNEFCIFVLRDKETNAEMIITVKYAAYAVGLKKFRLAEIQTLASAILVQCSNQLN